MFCLKNIWTDRKAYRLENSGPGLRFVVIYMRLSFHADTLWASSRFPPPRARGGGRRDEAQRESVWEANMRPVREFLASVQQPRRSQTGLSSLSGRSNVKA